MSRVVDSSAVSRALAVVVRERDLGVAFAALALVVERPERDFVANLERVCFFGEDFVLVLVLEADLTLELFSACCGACCFSSVSLASHFVSPFAYLMCH